MIIRARIVVTMDRAPIENGAVAVSENRIVDVGRFDDIKARNAGHAVDLGEQVLLPGLINAHCHLDYTCLRGKIPPQKSFTDWIRAINAQKSKLSPKDYLASINEGFEEAKRFGTTTIANLTAFPELVGTIQPSIRTWWFAELIDVRAPERANEIVDSAIESLGRARFDPVLSDIEGARVGPRAARLVHGVERSFSAVRRTSRNGNTIYSRRIWPSREKKWRCSAMVRDRSTSSCRASADRWMIVGIKQRWNFFSASTAARLDRALSHWIVAHLNELTESDFDLLEAIELKISRRALSTKSQLFWSQPIRI